MIMKEIITACFLILVLASPLSVSAFAQDREADEREPDSKYVEKPDAKKGQGSGLFDFLPFVDGRAKEVPLEDLAPAIPEQKKSPLSTRDMEEFRLVAERWLLASEFTEPTVRREKEDKYYRDYIVFAKEYTIEVVRGDSEHHPFIGHIYAKGDYFRTKSHDAHDDARSDFGFKYQPRDFRLIFDRVEKWEFSDNPNEEPLTFAERWEFRTLQVHGVAGLSEDALLSGAATAEDTAGAPETAEEKVVAPQPKNN
jgi:hypothetical protein